MKYHHKDSVSLSVINAKLNELMSPDSDLVSKTRLAECIGMVPSTILNIINGQPAAVSGETAKKILSFDPTPEQRQYYTCYVYRSEVLAKIRSLLDQGFSLPRVARELGMNINTINSAKAHKGKLSLREIYQPLLDFNPDEQTRLRCLRFVPVEEVKRKIDFLYQDGKYSLRSWARKMGLEPQALHKAYGASHAKSYSPEFALTILNFEPQETDWAECQTFVPVEPVREKLLKLLEQDGVTVGLVGNRVGSSKDTIRRILDPNIETVNRRTAEAILALRMTKSNVRSMSNGVPAWKLRRHLRNVFGTKHPCYKYAADHIGISQKELSEILNFKRKNLVTHENAEKILSFNPTPEQLKVFYSRSDASQATQRVKALMAQGYSAGLIAEYVAKYGNGFTISDSRITAIHRAEALTVPSQLIPILESFDTQKADQMKVAHYRPHAASRTAFEFVDGKWIGFTKNRCGHRGTYTRGCRCEPCKQSNRDYLAQWDKIHESRKVTTCDYQEAADHLLFLSSRGCSYPQIAKYLGCSPETILDIKNRRRRRVNKNLVDRILALNTTIDALQSIKGKSKR